MLNDKYNIADISGVFINLKAGVHFRCAFSKVLKN